MFGTAVKEYAKSEMSSQKLNYLIDTYGNIVLRIAYMYLKDKQHSEDVSQEVFIKVFRLNKKFESAEHEKAWIIRVTINLCKDQLRSFWLKRIAYGHEIKDTVSDVAEQVVKKSASKELYEKVLSLPEAFKTVIILYYYEGFSTKEISQILETPGATIRSRLKRARDRLRKTLNRDEFVQDN